MESLFRIHHHLLYLIEFYVTPFALTQQHIVFSDCQMLLHCFDSGSILHTGNLLSMAFLEMLSKPIFDPSVSGNKNITIF